MALLTGRQSDWPFAAIGPVPQRHASVGCRSIAERPSGLVERNTGNGVGTHVPPCISTPWKCQFAGTGTVTAVIPKEGSVIASERMAPAPAPAAAAGAAAPPPDAAADVSDLQPNMVKASTPANNIFAIDIVLTSQEQSGCELGRRQSSHKTLRPAQVECAIPRNVALCR